MISKFNSITFPLEIPFRGEISSKDINAFAKSVAIDHASISNILEEVVNMLNTGLSQDKLDGTSVAVDSEASESKDNGIFYYKHPTDSGQSRPLSVYEMFIALLQIMANTENGMKEGVKIGTESAPVLIANNEIIMYSWPYGDNIIDAKLMFVSGNEITAINPTDFKIYIDTSTLEPILKIQNLSGSSLNIFGYAWHPVFTF